jgi:hypothetical protein
VFRLSPAFPSKLTSDFETQRRSHAVAEKSERPVAVRHKGLVNGSNYTGDTGK